MNQPNKQSSCSLKEHVDYYYLHFLLVTYNDYRKFRKSHHGPTSRRSFEVWRRQGGKDRPNFKWQPKQHPTKRNQPTQNTKLPPISTPTIQLNFKNLIINNNNR